MQWQDLISNRWIWYWKWSELGGALAETFLEVFYERGAYGVITTHYANLKLLANELPHVTNANMLFDEKTLLPGMLQFLLVNTTLNDFILVLKEFGDLVHFVSPE